MTWDPADDADEPVYPIELLVPASLFHRLEGWAAESERTPEAEALWILNDYSPPVERDGDE